MCNMQFEINSRIKILIEEILKITPYEFSKKMGNKRPDGLYQILKNEAEPSPKTLNKIFEVYPEHKVWILTGESTSLETYKTNSTLPGQKCTNPDCLNKIEQLTRELHLVNKINKLLEEQLEQLKSEKGAMPPEKRDSGSVEEPCENKKAS